MAVEQPLPNWFVEGLSDGGSVVALQNVSWVPSPGLAEHQGAGCQLAVTDSTISFYLEGIHIFRRKRICGVLETKAKGRGNVGLTIELLTGLDEVIELHFVGKKTAIATLSDALQPVRTFDQALDEYRSGFAELAERPLTAWSRCPVCDSAFDQKVPDAVYCSSCGTVFTSPSSQPVFDGLGTSNPYVLKGTEPWMPVLPTELNLAQENKPMAWVVPPPGYPMTTIFPRPDFNELF
jgi:hypothetical protein